MKQKIKKKKKNKLISMISLVQSGDPWRESGDNRCLFWWKGFESEMKMHRKEDEDWNVYICINQKGKGKELM